MKKNYFTSALLLLTLSATSQAKYYLREQAGEPFGSQSNPNNMNTAFGTGNWTQADFQTVNPLALFQSSVCFIFMEGSSTGANELNTFLTANTTAMQNWVNAGGYLLINAAPNEGGNINLGFGATLNYTTATGPYITTISAVPAMTSHAIFSGPATPAGTVFTGNYTAQGFITATGGTAIVTSTAGTVLYEIAAGSGKAMFSTIITSNFMSPSPNAANFKSNILSYLGATCLNVGIPSYEAVSSGITVFPNPGPSIFTLELNNGSEKNIVVTDIHGRIVKQLVSSGDKTAIDLSTEDNGIYFAKVSSNNFTTVVKIVKK